MAFKTFTPARKPITLEEMGRKLAARRQELGDLDIPRNPGARRTPAKRALLAAIKDVGGEW